MAKYLARPCRRCNGYLGIVLREPCSNTALRAIAATASDATPSVTVKTDQRGRALFPNNVQEESVSSEQR